ncbi:MAG: gentisate 1,2-dioxygenase [Pseudomonadota bacterium]
MPDTIASRRQQLYERLDQADAAPLWAVMASLVTPQPRPRSVAAAWDYRRMRALLLEAGNLITAKEAERRVLILENPGIRGLSQITQSLYAGLQMILPGEIAPSHRHAAAALRFVIEGEGAYTAVDGERIAMRPGDFILTPSWTFHDHGNGGEQPVIWLDGLDVPMVNLFDASFAEAWPDGETQRLTRPEGDALARYGSNMLPLEYRPAASSPLFHYPYAGAKAALDRLEKSGPADPWHGIKLQYSNPASGGYPMPTMGACLQKLAAGFCGRRYRSTDATVFCVKEGAGYSDIGDVRIAWQAGDVFVAPSWAFLAHAAREDAVLFSFSDRPAQKALGLWREEYAAA